MGNYKNVAAVANLGGMFVEEELAPLVRCEATITIGWEDIPSGVQTRLCNSIKQGFTTSNTGVVPSLLRLLSGLDGVPPYPKIGYFGKKNLYVLVPEAKAKAQAYVTDLIAAGHMVDVDLSEATSTRGEQGWPGLEWLRVDGWKVKSKAADILDTAAASYRFRRRSSGADLVPATSKLTTLVRSWTAELLPLRTPFLRWVEAKHPLTFNMTYQPKR